MQPEFWLERWREGRIGFHQDDIAPLLQQYWPGLALPPDSPVLVPLCGKSKDMAWLAAQGHSVVGVELSELAAAQFFSEQGLTPKVWNGPTGKHYAAATIEIICGDIFSVGADVLSECTAVYDRAALIALPSEMRQHYVDHIYGQLPPTYQGLLITLDYPQSQLEGPPFSVADDEVQRLYAAHSRALVIERRDILAKESKFMNAGVSHLDTVVYHLSGKSAP